MTTPEEIKTLEDKCNVLYERGTLDFEKMETQPVQSEEADFIKKIDSYLDNQDLGLAAKVKAKLMMFKGKILGIRAEHSKSAEQILSKSLKMNPSDYETYNMLGYILWKKKDYKGSRQCYMESLNKQKNKEALRNLSIIQRNTGKDDELRKNIGNIYFMDQNEVILF